MPIKRIALVYALLFLASNIQGADVEKRSVIIIDNRIGGFQKLLFIPRGSLISDMVKAWETYAANQGEQVPQGEFRVVHGWKAIPLDQPVDFGGVNDTPKYSIWPVKPKTPAID